GVHETTFLFARKPGCSDRTFPRSSNRRTSQLVLKTRVAEKTGITNRLSVPVGSSTSTFWTWPWFNEPPFSSITPLNDGPSFLISHTTGNHVASGITPS